MGGLRGGCFCSHIYRHTARFTNNPFPFPPAETLVPQFTLWLTTPAAQFLHGRTVEANWDIDELLAQKDVIVNENLLTTTLRGYPFDTAEAWDKVVKDSLRKEAGTV